MCRYPLFETLAVINGNVMHLQYHQARLEKACSHYLNGKNTFDLNHIIVVPKEYQYGLVRCRIDYNLYEYNVRFFSYQPKKIHRYQCVYTENLDYRYKYSDRKNIEALKQDNSDEIIIINNGFVSDCTIGNLLFFKKGQWYSPANYLLKGTQLSYLLTQKLITLIEIRAEDIFSYERIMMINALNPFDEARSLPITSGTIMT